jgi:hypothetical protein
MIDQDEDADRRAVFASFSAVFGALFFVVGCAMGIYGLMSKPIGVPFIGLGIVAVLVGAVLLANAVQLDREG